MTPNQDFHTPSLNELRASSFSSYVRSIYTPRALCSGVSKVSLPPTYCEDPVDPSGRGPTWQSGSALGDRNVKAPIKQAAAGKGGVYEFHMLSEPEMTVAEFRSRADAYKQAQIKVSRVE